MTSKTDTTSSIAKAILPYGSYTFVQSAMLFIHYGLSYQMPWWAVWFPTVVAVTIMAIILLILLIMVIFSAIFD